MMRKISLIEKQFLKEISSPLVEFISFDIFDTLVYRNTVRPTHIFRRMAQKEFIKTIFPDSELFEQFRMDAEQKARQNSQEEEITLTQIYNELPLTKQQQQKFMDTELKIEKDAIFINKSILRLIDIALKHNKKILFISDTYFTKNEIEKLVFKKVDIPYHKLFISSQYKMTKFSGKLFSQVLDELHIKGTNLLHIGDNYHSDIQNAAKYNIQSILYNLPKEYKLITELDNQYMKNAKHDTFQNYRIFSALNNPYENEQKKFFYNFGALYMAPIIWDFCHYLKEIYHKNKLTQMNFCMREGQIFHKFIKYIDPTINTNILYVSRKSTFLASLNLKEIKNNSFRLENYEDFNVKNLYELFKIPIDKEEIKKVIDFKFHKADKFKAEYINILHLIQEDFISKKSTIIKNIQKEKNLLQDYLKDKNFHNNSMIVEFGGTGTIPTNIDNLMSEKSQKLNVLFFMHDKGIKKMSNKLTTAYLSYKEHTKHEIRAIHSFPTIFEILFNGNYTTTLGYKKEQNNISVNIATKNPLLKQKQQKLLKAFNNGVKSFFNTCLEHQCSKQVLNQESVLRLINRFLKIPSTNESLHLGSLYHEAGFGSNHVFPIIEQKHIKYLEEYGIDRIYKYSKLLDKKVPPILWPEGLIAKEDSSYLIRMNNLEKVLFHSEKINPYVHKLMEDIINQKLEQLTIYGTGEIFQQIIPYLTKKNIRIAYVFDSRAHLIINKINGFRITALHDIQLEENSTIVIASDVYRDEIFETIKTYMNEYNIQLNII
jgi:predicted HAD superfamily hydrolase